MDVSRKIRIGKPIVSPGHVKAVDVRNGLIIIPHVDRVDDRILTDDDWEAGGGDALVRQKRYPASRSQIDRPNRTESIDDRLRSQPAIVPADKQLLAVRGNGNHRHELALGSR